MTILKVLGKYFCECFMSRVCVCCISHFSCIFVRMMSFEWCLLMKVWFMSVESNCVSNNNGQVEESCTTFKWWLTTSFIQSDFSWWLGWNIFVLVSLDNTGKKSFGVDHAWCPCMCVDLIEWFSMLCSVEWFPIDLSQWVHTLIK